MGAIRDVFGKEPEEVDLDDIDKLIIQRREECHNLEYKSPDILGDPKKLSQWVSAFLNADGGLIIIGVSEDDPKKEKAKIFPEKKVFVGEEYPKERVEQLVFSNIHSLSKPDVRIYPIRDPNESAQVIYLIEIPQGEVPPYQAADGKYYRRLNSIKYPMAHYEIADLFGRRIKPKLVVFAEIAGEIKHPQLELRVSVVNEGKAIAKYPMVTISLFNWDILTVKQGPKSRIDKIRSNVPSLQWVSDSGVVHSGSRLVIWRLILQTRGTDEPYDIYWETTAEYQERVSGTYKFNEIVVSESQYDLGIGPIYSPPPYNLPQDS